MGWIDDPAIQEQLAASRARSGITRSAIVWTPIFVAVAFAFLFFLVDETRGGDRGTWFLVVVLGVLTLLFGFQSVQALRDLRAGTGELEGTVVRRWTRSDSLVIRSHYIRMEGKILRGERFLLEGVEAHDRVRVRYYPHSGVIAALERLPSLPPERDPATAPASL